MAKRNVKMQTDSLPAHLPKMGAKWNKKSMKMKREFSYFFMKREHDMRCWRRSSTKRDAWSGLFQGEETGESELSEERDEKSRDGSE